MLKCGRSAGGVCGAVAAISFQAFDTVNHKILIKKLSKLNLPVHIIFKMDNIF